MSTAAAAKKRPAIPESHPAWQAALRAPVEPESEEERLAVAEAMQSGDLVPGEIVSAEIARRARRG
jgi:hypothetical protein